MSVGERRARMGLCGLGAMGSPAVAEAVAAVGAEAVWEGLRAEMGSSAMGRRAAVVDPDLIARATAACGSRFLIPGDSEWPAEVDLLAGVSVGGQAGPPLGLWVRGTELPALTGGVAVVGARACTTYGEQVAATLAADVAAAGRPVVSGLAFGIDAAAHRGALGSRGLTLGVVASGLDQPYPSANARLADAVIGQGALVSEMPPGYRPTRYAFLARNRLIAALSAAVVVVEASHRSGAKNTASWAAAMGRPVMAVPGPVTSSLTATPHRLIRDGEAVLVTSADDVLSLLAPLGTREEPDGRGESRPIDALPSGPRELRESIRARESVSVAELAARTGQSMVDVLANLAELIERGWVQEEPDGTVRLPGRPTAQGQEK